MPEELKSNSKRPRSENIGTYLRKKQKQLNISLDEIAKNTRLSNNNIIPYQAVTQILENNILPIYMEYLMKICDTLDVEEKVIKEWEENDAAYQFAYWNILHPEAPKIECVGSLIRKRNKEYKRKDIIKGTGFAAPNISNHELRVIVITYDTFVRYADFYGIAPIDLLREFSEDKSIKENEDRLIKYVKGGRLSVGLTAVEAAESIDVPLERYNKLEDCRTLYHVEDVMNMSAAFGLSAQTLYKYVREANLSARSSAYDKATPRGKMLPVGERRVTDLTDILGKYKYIINKRKKVETHTLTTLIYLILLSGNSEKYRNEINYYIENMFKKGYLYKEIYNDPEFRDLSHFDVFNELRHRSKYSHRQLGSLMNVSNVQILKLCKGDYKFKPLMLKELSEVCGYSPVVLLEGYLDTKEAEREEAPLIDVIATVECSLIWNLEGETVETNTLAEILRILFDSKRSSKQKYESIKELKYW